MEKSLSFNEYYEKIALEKDCHYVNLQAIVKYSEIDGLHYDKRGHAVIASVVASKINEIFSWQSSTFFNSWLILGKLPSIGEALIGGDVF